MKYENRPYCFWLEYTKIVIILQLINTFLRLEHQKGRFGARTLQNGGLVHPEGAFRARATIIGGTEDERSEKVTKFAQNNYICNPQAMDYG